MALAYGNFHELSHQLRFLLFEIGIGLPQSSIDYFITLSHRESLKRLQRAALSEGLISAPIASHHVHDFIDQLQLKLKKSRPESQFFQWNSLREELNESIANEALAHAYRQYWHTQLRKEANQYDSLWSWMSAEQTAHQSLMFLEQWGSQGDAYLPSFRAKMGFTRREVLQNSPEFQAKISIHWCALSKQSSHLSSKSSQFTDLIQKSFPGEFHQWQEKLKFKRIDPEKYYPLPVHPWQWRNHIQVPYAQMLDNKSLILLPHHQTLMPSMSYETMMSDSTDCLIKLALNNKNNRRNSDDFIHQGPEISSWIHAILNQEKFYQNTLILAKDLSSLKVSDTLINDFNQKDLQVSLLENSSRLIHSDQKIVPLASLFTNSPLTNTPLFIEIIKTSNMDPLSYFNEFCHMVLQSQLHLLLKYGVALGINQQSTHVVFSNNLPCQLIIKNLEECKISIHPFFKDIEKSSLNSNLHLKTNDLELLRTSFIHSTFQNNIYYWINGLHHEFQLPVQLLWSKVKQVLHNIFNKLPKDIHPSLLSWQKHLIFHDNWKHQCVLSMRLNNQSNKDIYTKQSNLLEHS